MTLQGTPMMPPHQIIWGEDDLPHEAGTEHFLVVGATGSGKTVLIHRLMNSVLGAGQGVHKRAVVYDPKQDVVTYLYGMGPDARRDPEGARAWHDRVRILHPFDQRCCAWDLAADIDGPVSARQMATILVPEPEGGNQRETFFTDAVRDLLTGVILAFINCVPTERAWTFRDVILTLMYEPYLRFVLALDRTRDRRPFPTVTRL